MLFNPDGELAGLRAFARTILVNANFFSWTLHGLGMIRTTLDTDEGAWRLNVWHNEVRLHAVTEMHDHPWNFQSFVLNGTVYNTKYTPGTDKDVLYDYYVAECGPNGKGADPTKQGNVRLHKNPVDVYALGENYHMHRDEIHKTGYDAGTVTLLFRSNYRVDHAAKLYAVAGTQLGSAAPGIPTTPQLNHIVSETLARWWAPKED